MPIYSFGCPSCGKEKDCLMSWEKSKTAEVICDSCSLAMIKKVSLIAKTSDAWEGGWREGLSSNPYSVALGRKVTNRREERKILESKGFIAESDLGKDWFDNTQAKQLEKYQAQDKKTELYNKVLAETGSKEMAIEQAFPARECLDGTLDNMYNEKITI